MSLLRSRSARLYAKHRLIFNLLFQIIDTECKMSQQEGSVRENEENQNSADGLWSQQMPTEDTEAKRGFAEALRGALLE